MKAPAHARTAPADAALRDFFQDHLEASMRLRPLDATRLGDHRFDHLLDDLSAAAHTRWLAYTRGVLRELPRRVDEARLSAPARIDYAMVRDALERDLWVEQHIRPLELDPRVYTACATEGVYLLFVQSPLPPAANVANALARMAQAPRMLAAARENLRRPPRVVTETAIQQNLGAIGFFERELFELAGKGAPARALKAGAAPVLAALRRHQRFLERELLPRADGEWRLGPRTFARKFELELAAGVSPGAVLAEAEVEFQRVTAEMYVIARQLWCRLCPRRTLPPTDAEGRRATVRAVLEAIGRDHARPEDLVREARATVAGLKRFISARGLLRLPVPDRCQIVEMPEFRRGNSLADLTSAPPLDANRPSLYAIGPGPRDWPAARVRSLLEEYNRRMLRVLTIHEAYPGHYVQLDYANRQPSLVRRVCGSGVYCEGWAVYCEQMLLDEGYGGGDLALRLVALKFYLRAVANAILDQGLHGGNLDEAAALRFLCDEAFQSDGEARLKIVRAKQSSVQLSSYFVGRMAFARLRQEIQREQGDAFDLGRFHDVVLRQGSVPVKYLPELVRAGLRRTGGKG